LSGKLVCVTLWPVLLRLTGRTFLPAVPTHR